MSRLEESFVILVDLAKLSDYRLEALAQSQDALAQSQVRLSRNVEALTDIMMQMADAQKNANGRLDALALAQKETTERLNAFIAIVSDTSARVETEGLETEARRILSRWAYLGLTGISVSFPPKPVRIMDRL